MAVNDNKGTGRTPGTPRKPPRNNGKTSASRITAAQRARVLRLHEAEVGRNDIARLTGLSATTVSKIVKEHGGEFDRAQTRAATEAKQADLAAQRARIVAMLQSAAEDDLKSRDTEVVYIDHGGKEFTEVRWSQDRPHIADRRTLTQSASIAMTTVLKIEDADKGGMGAAAASLVESIRDGLAGLADVPDPDDCDV